MRVHPTTRQWLIGIGFLVAYVGLDYVSYVKPYRDMGITPWNPPAGLAIALMFLEGLPMAPFILAAPLLADIVVRHTPLALAADVLTSMLVGGLYVAAGLVLQRTTQFDPRFRAVRDVLTLVAVAAVTAIGAALVLGLMFLAAGHLLREEFSLIIWRSTVGDVIGILTVVPLILLWRTQRPWPPLGPTMGLQCLAVLVSLVIVFGYQDATAFQLFYLLFLPVLWVALTYGPPGAAVALAVVQIGMVIGAEIRFGTDPGFGALQVLMIVLSITGLIVAAVGAEREDAAARLRDQQAALNRTLRIRSAGEVAATIAHEMNQPLTVLATYGGIAAKALREGDNALATRAIGKVESESQRAASVLTGIRDLLRQGALNKTRTDVAGQFVTIAELLRQDLAARGVSLLLDVEESLPAIQADPVQLQQALHNLIINSADAIESVGRRGSVTLRAARAGAGGVRIEVCDDGPGFPPGYDVSNPAPFTSTKADGSGIGLTVVRSIAEAHGGRFSIQSSARGARVLLQLPLS